MFFFNQKPDGLFTALKPSGPLGVIAFGQTPYFPTWNIVLIAPLHKAFAFFANFYNYTDAAIACLLRPRSPSAITWLVVSVIIAPVQRVALRWSQAHVIVKVFKAIKPPSANTNAAAAIYCVLFVIGIVASSFHAIPRPMFWCVTQAMSFLVVVAVQSLGGPLTLDASAAYGVAAAQVGSGYCCFDSTITAAFPKSISPAERGRCTSEDSEVSEPKSFEGMSNRRHERGHIITWGK